jgi:hypothetical protein
MRSLKAGMGFLNFSVHPRHRNPYNSFPWMPDSIPRFTLMQKNDQRAERMKKLDEDCFHYHNSSPLTSEFNVVYKNPIEPPHV